jgi:hypothetical protein
MNRNANVVEGMIFICLTVMLDNIKEITKLLRINTAYRLVLCERKYSSNVPKPCIQTHHSTHFRL